MVRKEKPDTKLGRHKMVDPARDQQVNPIIAILILAQVDIHPFKTIYLLAS